ncbi:MAG TPA: anthranilate synthase component I [Candidatus Limnocylindrales bacterium]|nr:anthranilate synthase component I [Candidatus Limnocylindrales bacterium]
MPVVPDLEGFRRLAAQSNTIPVYREVAADLDTPVSAFLKLHRSGQGFLLESVEGGDRWGRYSVLGTDPLMTLRARGGVTVVHRRGGGRMEIEADPIEALRRVLAPFHQAKVEGLSRFAGGFVGYLSYDLVRTIEKLPVATEDDLGAADVAGLIADNFVLFDNVTHTMKVVSLAVVGTGDDVTQAYERAVASVEATVRRLRTGEIPLPAPHQGEVVRPASNHTPQEYCAAVEKCLEYIRAGDIFQVVISQRFRAPLSVHPFSIYRALRTINPSPYMFYLDLEDEVVVGASPEVMVKVEGNQVAVRPIAGTIRRGATPEEDEALVAQMLSDPKEQAEHIMLVDLGRNDIGRVAETGTVKVSERFTVERYSHVNHIVSHVSGTLAPGRDCFDAFRATFPAGTLSGAPKVRAMEIIEEVEKSRRGVYGGAVGYVDFLGNLDTCIAIRTLFVKNGTVYVQAGAGVVADSVPMNEQAECEAKARAMMLALDRAVEIEQSA